MTSDTDKFKILFKKYRLKAEIPTLSQFGHLLAEKGFNYEDSIFSHWQNGTRIPQYRNILIKLLEIFVERGAITTLTQANEFLISANQGYLSEEELKKIPLKLNSKIFQVPNEIDSFSGRQKVLEMFLKTDLAGKVIVIHGPAGVGKTALAIKPGHLLRDKYQDGVLWYKIEEDNISDILLSIAKELGEDISGITDLQVRSTVVRSLLSGKNILLFLDSAELSKDLELLIPNSKFCTTIITSQKSSLKIPVICMSIELKPFTSDESLELFKDILQDKYSKISRQSLLKIASSVGNLPLAVHILARNIFQRNISLRSGEVPIKDLYHIDEGLESAISLSYNKLDTLKKSVLVSASIFKGKDFSSKSIGYINGLSVSATITILQSLIDLSLLEHSTKNRYRIHPAIKDFVREKLDYPRSSHLSLIASLIFSFFVVWWIYLQLFLQRGNIQYYLFSGSYGLLALYGGICGINTSLKWGGLKTLLGKSVFMFSLGLFAQVFGQIVYSYYANFYKISAPYPSIGDIGFFGTIPFYIYGAILLANSSGIKINFRSFRKKIIALIIPVTMVIIGYLLYLQNYIFDWNKPVKIFLDFAQPLGDAMVISIAIIIFIFSRNILDGIMRSKALLILLALVAQFFADYVFLYDSSNFYSGNYMDFIYLLAYFLMTLALLSLRSLNINVKESSRS